MPLIDAPVSELEQYRSAVTEPADFDDFWAATLGETRDHALSAEFTPVDSRFTTIDSYDVTFAGYAGEPIRAWLHLPAGATGPLPGVVQYQGYGSGRGTVQTDVMWANAGYALLRVDTRGQGSARMHGHTPDGHGSGPSSAGFMTRGITDPQQYFYRRVYSDAVRAVEALRSHAAVDAARVSVTGGSQGGGISLAVSGLVPDLFSVMPNVPFLCDFPRAIRIIDTDPYLEIVRYLASHRTVAEVTRTLAYFDGVVFASRATAPALFSVALMDDVCPPSTVYAAYNAYAGAKEMRVYEFNEHEGGAAFHDVEQLDYLARLIAAG